MSNPTVNTRPGAFTVHDPRIQPEPNTGCWVWMGTTNNDGYGLVSIKGKTNRAHRVVWERRVGPIPAGMVLDHKCRERSCCNPDHLRLVTWRENALTNSTGWAARHAQQTHCKNGHPLTGDNLLLTKKRCRRCRACSRAEYLRTEVRARELARKRMIVALVRAQRGGEV